MKAPEFKRAYELEIGETFLYDIITAPGNVELLTVKHIHTNDDDEMAIVTNNGVRFLMTQEPVQMASA